MLKSEIIFNKFKKLGFIDQTFVYGEEIPENFTHLVIDNMFLSIENSTSVEEVEQVASMTEQSQSTVAHRTQLAVLNNAGFGGSSADHSLTVFT